MSERSTCAGALAGGLSLLAVLSACSGDSADPGPTIAAVELAATVKYLEVSGTLQLSATARDGAGAPVTGARITWSSSATNIATVDGNGLVRGMTPGSARITAAAGTQTTNLDLAVRDNAPLATQLSGRVERVRLTLEAGKVYHATSNLQLVADKALRIDGTLLIDDGVTVSIGSRDSTIITGIVVPAGTVLAPGSAAGSTAPSSAPPADLAVWGRNIDLGSTPQTANIQSTGNLFIGGVPDITGGPPGPLIINHVYLAGGSGQPGTATSKDGGNSGNVEIGTAAARNAAGTVSGGAGAAFPDIILIGASHFEGRTGGSGYDIRLRADAAVADNTITAEGGKGGRGGSVLIETPGDFSMAAATALELIGGQGGKGGGISFSSNTQPDRLRDGSGPNGEGESLVGTTGWGNDGGSVRVVAGRILTGGFNPYVIGGRGGEPGSFFASGGDGINGARGGDVTARIGLRGGIGEGVVGPTKFPDPPEARRVEFSLTSAIRGGGAANNSMPGGAGGKVDVQEVGGGPAYLMFLSFSFTGTGGSGFNGCAVSPITNGTNGGPGGTITAPGNLAPNNLSGFRGGPGGDGNQPGTGGAEGRDLSRNVPLGAKGADGRNCPSLVTASATQIAFTHTVGVTPCPQFINNLVFTNQTSGTVALTFTLVGTNSLNLGSGGFTLAPGVGLPLSVFFNCNRTTSFTGTIRVTATQGQTTQTIDIPVTGTVQ